MSIQTTTALRAAWQPLRQSATTQSRLIVAGATGVLGAEVLRRLAASGRFAHTQVLAKEPMATSLAQVGIVEVTGELPAWQTVSAQVGVVMFEPPRLYYERERALWTPAQGRLPDAVKRGLANLDEQALAALGFDRLLLVRSAQKIPSAAASGLLSKVAAWMLSTLSYMIPATEQPVRPSKLAEFIDVALHQLPPGTHVASPELLWRAADQGDTQLVVQAWLNSTTLQHQTA